MRGLLVVLSGCAACSGADDTWLPGAVAHAGQLQLALKNDAAIEVDRVVIVLMAPDESTRTYEMEIGVGGAASISLGGLLPGQYGVTFSATTRQGDPCAGSAEFDVEPDLETRVHVEVACDIE